MAAIVSGNNLGLDLTSLKRQGESGDVQARQANGSAQSYVNVCNGNLILQERDGLLVGPGMAQQAIRTYNSQGQFNDDNGDNWTMGVYRQQITLEGTLNQADSSLTRRERDGGQSLYRWDVAQDCYLSTDGADAYQRIRADGADYLWTNGDHTLQERYARSNGRLLSTTDAQGNQLDYRFDSQGNLTRVTNSNGEATCYDYSGNNLTQIRLLTSGDQTLTCTRYTYDEQNRLTAVTVDLSPEDNSVSDLRIYVTHYSYDGDSKRIAGMTRPDGSQLQFTYVEIDQIWRVASITDGLGQITRYAYAANTTTVSDALGQNTIYTYDSAGQLTSVTTAPTSDVSALTRYEYNQRGDVLRIIDADGRSTEMAYDDHGNQIRQRDSAGNLIERCYNVRNQLIAETISNSSSNTAAQTSRTIYDDGERNLLRFMLSAEGRVTEYRYDLRGQRICSLQYSAARYDLSALSATQAPTEAVMAAWALKQDVSAARRTDMQYDGRSQLSKITTYTELDSVGNGIDDGASSVQYVYDQSGQLLKTIAAAGAVTTWTYDGLGRVIAEDEDGQLTLTQYDDSGNQHTTTTADGLSTNRIYDGAGRLLSVTHSSVGGSLGVTRYTYDAGNRLIMSEDPSGCRQRIFYDGAGRKVAEIDGNGSLTEYSYNLSGQLTRTRACAIAVDAALLMHDGVIVFPDLATIRPPANAADQISWSTYDAAGRLSKEINAQGAVTVMQYDAGGQLLGTRRHATPIDTRQLGTAPADTDITPQSTDQDRHTRRFYEDGLLRATLDAEGYLSEIRYDNSGQEMTQIHYAQATSASLRASGTLDNLRPTVANANDRIERKIRNNRGQLIGVIDAEGYLTEMRYDAGGNVTHRVRHANPATAVNPTTQDQSLLSLRPASTAQDSVHISVYDRNNRLLEENDAQGTITRYRYDKNGRLLATIKAANTSEQRQLLAQYDLFGRLTGELNATGAALLNDNLNAADIDALWQRHAIRHTYDAAGRRLSTTRPEGVQSFYVYDAGGRLTHTINALGEVTATRYDALGQVSARIQYAQRLNDVVALLAGPAAHLQAALNTLQQDPGNSTVQSRYDNLGLLTERIDAIGAAAKQYYNSFGELIRQERIDGSRRNSDSHQYDRRGLRLETVRDVGNTNLASRMQYDAFGRPVQSTDACGNITRMEYDRLGRQIVTTDAIGGRIVTVYDAFDRIIHQHQNGELSSYRYHTAARGSTLTTPDQVTVSTVFNRHGQQQRVTDGKGNVTRFNYDAAGNLTSQINDSGISTQAWDAANRLIETTDGDGRQVRMQYDAANRLLTRTVDPDGLRLVTSYAYDARGRQLSITQADGQRTQFAYDAKGRLLAQTVDPDGLALTTRYTYDADGNTLSITSPNGSISRYRYDGAGRRIEEQIDPQGLALTRQYHYDANGNLTQAIDANGNTTRYVFDKLNRQIWSVDPNGAPQALAYDGSSQRVTRQTRWPHTQDEIRHSRTGEAYYQMLTEFHRYDAMGRPRWHINAAGAVQKLDYDANGNVVRRISYATLLDDQQLLLLEHTAFAAIPLSVTADAAHDLVQRSVYDDGNRIRFEIDSLGAIIEHRYDASGTLRERIAYRTPLSAELRDQEHLTISLQVHVEKHRGDVGNQHNTYLHDNAGRRQYDINAEGGVTSYRYDGHGNLLQTIGHATLLDSAALTALRDGNYDSAAIAAALQSSSRDRISTTLYDAAHRAQYQIDAGGYLTEQQHDGNGNLIRSTRYTAPVTLMQDDAGKLQLSDIVRSGAQDITEYRHYDAANRLRYRIDGLGHVTEQRYDGLGQITQILNYQQALAADVARGDLLAVERALRGEPADAVPAQPAIDVTAAAAKPSPQHIVTDPGIDNENAPHLRISSGGDSMAVHAIYGNFAAGQTIRLSIQTKSDQHTVPVVRLFGSDAMHETTVSSSHGHAEWQTLTVELTLQKADVLYVSLSAQRDATVAGDAFVLYQDMRIACDEITDTTRQQSFASIKFSAAQSQDLDPATLQARGNLLSLSAEQRTWSGGWVTRGLVEHRVAASANASVAATDNETNPLQAHSLKLGAGDNDTVVRYLGQFNAGDTVTLTVRSRSDLDTMTSAGLIGLHGEQSWEQLPQVYGTAGSWQTITVTAKLTQNCALLAYLSGYCPSSSPARDNSVLFQDLRVSSTAQGIVLQDDFSAINFGDQALLQWNSTQVVDAALWYQQGNAAQHTHSAMELAATRQTDAVIANEMSPHLRICSTGDSLAVKRLNRNQLTAGDVQTLTLQVKSDHHTAPDIRLFGTHAEHQSNIESIYGDGEWKTVTLTLTLTRPDAIFVSLGSRRNPLAGGNGFVLYRDLKLKHNDLVLDTDNFKYLRFAAAETQGLDPDTLQPDDHLQNALEQEDLLQQKRGWVTRGIAEHRSNNGGTSHVDITNIQQPVVLAADAVKIGSDFSLAMLRLGQFQQGDTVTVSLRAKSDSQTMAIPSLFGTNKDGFRFDGPIVYGNDRWNTITFSVTLRQDEEVFIELSGYGAGKKFRATNKVYFSDIKVSSARQGVLLENALTTAPIFGDYEDLGFDSEQWKFSNPNIDSTMWYTSGAVEACNTAEIANERNPETLAPYTDATTMQEVPPTNIASVSGIPVEPVPLPGHIPASLLRYAYDRSGNLIQSTDALGHTEHYRYDALNQRISFTNALGATTHYAYDAVGNLLSSTDALGNSESSTYDSFQRRTSSSDRLGAVTRYDYDQLGRLLLTTDALGHTEAASYDALGNRSSSTNKLGGISRYAHDTLGRQISETLAVSATDADGQAHAIINRQQYDAFGNRITTIEAAGLAEQRTTRYTFDALGRPLQKIGEATRIYIAGSGWKDVNPTETSRYDSRGNLIEKGDANGNLSRSYYDANNRVIAELSASGALTTKDYDAAGNVVRQRIYGDVLAPPVDDALPTPINPDNYREIRYVYDAGNRLISTIQAQVGVAEQDASSGNFTYAITDLITRTNYNDAGQVTMQQDAAGQRSYFYYNLLGQKVLAIDVGAYVTTWDVDANGKVLREHAWARRLDGNNPWTEGSDPVLLRQQLQADVADVISEYEYDLQGRLIRSSRLNVHRTSIGDDGALQHVAGAGTAHTHMVYNANGDLRQKTDAKGHVSDWEYDLHARVNAKLLPVAIDYQGNAMRHTVRYHYNGLHALTRETETGSANGIDRDDIARHTRHHYDQAGRRSSQTLATGDVVRYGYDAHGNTSAEITERRQADGTILREITSMSYDGAQREIRRISGSVDADDNPHNNNDSMLRTHYDAYGNLTGKTTAGGDSDDNAQEFIDYDAAGRIWRSNTEGGITKVWCYDRNGKPTLTLQSATLDLRSMTLTQIHAELAQPNSQITATISIYDERGNLKRTIEPPMNSSRSHASLMALQGGGRFEGVQLTSGSTLTREVAAGYLQGADAVVDSAGVSGSLEFRASTHTWIPHRNEWLGSYSRKANRWFTVYFGNMKTAFQLVIPNMSAIYGAHKIMAVFNVTGTRPGGSLYWQNRIAFEERRDNLSFSHIFESSGTLSISRMLGSQGKNYTIDLYVIPQNGENTKVGTLAGSAIWGQTIQGSSLLAPGSNFLRLNNQTLQQAAQVNLYHRPQGSTGIYTQLATSTLPGQDATYVANMAGMHAHYDMLMVAVDQHGKLLRSDQFAVNRANNTVTRDSGVANLPVFTANGMHLAGLQLSNGKLATTLSYQLDQGEIVTLAARNDIPGLFEIPVTQAANLRMVLHDADGGSEHLVGAVDPANGHSNLQYLKYADASLSFRNLDQQAVTLDIRYRLEGSDSWHSKQLLRQSGQGSDWTWDTQADGLVPDPEQSYRYEVQFDARDADDVKCNNGSAVIAAGAIDGGTYTTASITGAARPRWISFNPDRPAAQSLTLSYRASGTQDEETTVHLQRLPSGIFKFDSSALPPDQEYDYRYTALDAAGNPVHSMQGCFRSESRRQVSDGSNVQWVMAIDPDLHSTTQISRSQQTDAFGNITFETDGNGNTTEFVYNTLGQLTLRRNAATDITQENGYIVQGHRADARYYYNVGGQLVGAYDADGNLTTQRWHNGSGTPKVAQEWHADGGSKKNAYDVFGNLRTSINEDNWQTDYRYDANNRLIAMDRPVSVGVKASDRYEYDVKGQRIATTNALGHRSTVDYDLLGRVTRRVSAAGRVTTLRYSYDNSIRTIGDTRSGGWRRVMTDANGHSMTDELDVHGRVTSHADLGGRIFTYRNNLRGLIANQRSTNGQHIDYRYYGNGYLKETIDRGVGTAARYEYDNNGNRTFEGYLAEDGNFAFQQQTVTYDARNRVIKISDPRYTIHYEYDANGNKRHISSNYTDGLGQQRAHQDYWYRYDRMHRFTISMGQLRGGQRARRSDDSNITIERGEHGDGVALSYTQAGLRASASYAAHGGQSAHAEHYYYDGRGLLQQTHLSDGSRISRTNDKAGRVIEMKVSDTNGALLQHQQRTWDHDHHLLQEHDVLRNKGTRYELMADGTIVASQTYSADAADTALRTTYSYDWWDSAKQAGISLHAKNATVDSWNKVWRPGFSHFSYDVNGHSKLAYDEDSKRAFSYWTDNEGQVLKRQELIGGSYDGASGKMNGATKNREHSYYYLDSKRIGDVGNDQTERTDYAQQLASLRSNDNRRSYEKFTPSNAADFDANYQPINSDYPAAAPSAYTVRAGDTLQSVARALWGDATLWYLLAEANGLIGTQPSAALTANSTLIVPNQVTNIHHTSATFKPYNPGKALGDTSPTLPSAPPPPPPPSSGCGGIGGIIAIVVIVVAAVFTAGAVLAALGPMMAGPLGAVMAGAAAGMASSVVAQGVGMALGVQDSFSWKGVAQSGLMGGITAGIGSAIGAGASSASAASTAASSTSGATAAAASASSGWLAAAGQAAAINVASQGIMMALGQQRSFDWRGVAASAAGSAAGSYAKGAGYGSFGRGMARGVASYAATGGNFQRALPAIVGSAIGEHFVNSYNAPAPSKMEQQLQQAQQQPPAMSKKQHDFLWSSTAGPGGGITNRSLIRSEYERPMQPLPDVIVTANSSEIRPLNDVDAFFAFNAWGRGLNGAWDGLKNIASGVKEMGDAAADVIRYPTEALASRILPEHVTGQRPYQPVSMLGQSLQQQGLGATATNMAAGIMRGTAQTVAAPFRAAYLRNDARELGRSLMEVVPLVVGATGALRLRANTGLRQTGAGSGLNAADDLYNVIRADVTDVARIAENTGIKPQNIQKVKDHIFNQEHLLDRYRDYGVPPVRGRFDSDLDMANSWIRLTDGTHTKIDMQLIKHEAAEAWYMRKNGPSYLDAHTAADKRYPSPY